MSAAVQGVPRPPQHMLLSGRTPGLYPNMRPPHLKQHTHSKPQKEDNKHKEDSPKKK